LNPKKYLFLLITLVLFSCSTDDYSSEVVPVELESGVVITFDDDYVDEWVEVNSILAFYDWKATFFVTKFNQLSQQKTQKLKDLKSFGHEIGGHGLNHLKATAFISENGTAQYLSQEIFPMINFMSENNLEPTSFAYPYGARNGAIDEVLLNEFQVLRGTCYGSQNASLQNCYFNNSRVVLGLGIDKNYAHFSIPYFLSILEYAKQNNKIVVFYAHKPVLQFQNNYETEYETLIEICKFVKNNNMKFYKISELKNIENTI
jgi:peptidoglycan/xylan/chitin deacetylase (PgdA/CDA1 family)